MRQHGYYRSTAAWRVRIALNLKGVSAEHWTHHLRNGERRSPDYLRLNPQGLVPTLELADDTPLTQSLAICEWLEETHPTPSLLPGDDARARKSAPLSSQSTAEAACQAQPAFAALPERQPDAE
jgi:maleylpyruvate isomerase